jgi:hypothetical protein
MFSRILSHAQPCQRKTIHSGSFSWKLSIHQF